MAMTEPNSMDIHEAGLALERLAQVCGKRLHIRIDVG